VLDGDQAPPKRGTAPHQFSTDGYCGQMAGCITIPLGTQVGLGPDDTVLDRDPALPPKRFTVPPNFRPMSIVAKWLPISATAELLFNVYYVFIYFVFWLFSR